MKFLRYALILLLIVSACSSSEPKNEETDINLEDKYANVVQVTPLNDVKTSPSKIYVDSVKVVDYKDDKALLISGNFANNCTSLKKVTHSLNKNKLHITLVGHKPANKMCAMTLTPFTYIYNKLSRTKFKQLTTVVANETTFGLDDS